MKATKTYLILCQMDSGEITLQEAHKLIFRLSDVIKSVCEDEELQPIECEKHGSCKNCPHYKPVKQTVL